MAQYNRKLIERWLKKAPMSTINKTKEALAKLISYHKEIEAIHGDDPITMGYITAHSASKDGLKDMFHNYYSNLVMVIPLVRTPATQEGKKLKLEPRGHYRIRSNQETNILARTPAQKTAAYQKVFPLF